MTSTNSRSEDRIALEIAAIAAAYEAGVCIRCDRDVDRLPDDQERHYAETGECPDCSEAKA